MRQIVGLALGLMAWQPALAGGQSLPCPPLPSVSAYSPCGPTFGCAESYANDAPPPQVYAAPCAPGYVCGGSDQVYYAPAYVQPCGPGCGDMVYSREAYAPPPAIPAPPVYAACDPRLACYGYPAPAYAPVAPFRPEPQAYMVPAPVAMLAPAPGMTLDGGFFQGDSSVGPMPVGGGGYGGGGYTYAPYSASDMPSAGARAAAYGSAFASVSSTVRSSVTIGGGGVGHPHPGGMPGKGGPCCQSSHPGKGSGFEGGYHGGGHGSHGGGGHY